MTSGEAQRQAGEKDRVLSGGPATTGAAASGRDAHYVLPVGCSSMNMSRGEEINPRARGQKFECEVLCSDRLVQWGTVDVVTHTDGCRHGHERALAGGHPAAISATPSRPW